MIASQTTSLSSLLILLLLPLTSAHLAIWHPSMYGWDASDPNQADGIVVRITMYYLTLDI